MMFVKEKHVFADGQAAFNFPGESNFKSSISISYKLLHNC